MEKIIFFDTTMRDGRQCPGADVTDFEYFDYMQKIAKTGMDIVEAGFPSSSDREFSQVYTVAEMAGSGEFSPQVAALCQLRQEQVERTIRALEPAVAGDRAFFHTYIPVDPDLLAASMGEVNHAIAVQSVYDAVRLAHHAQMAVQFSPEGYSNLGTNFDWTTDLIRAAIEGGATYINCPDTIGGASHWQGDKYYIENMRRHKAIIDREYTGNQVVWSVHNHNDLGNALENSIQGIVHGIARKVEGTMGGVGERAGNVDLMQVVMNLRLYHEKNYDTRHIDISTFVDMGNWVSDHMLSVQPHYPIIGSNAYRHTSGGHVNALLHNPQVYHPFDPESVGGKMSLVFGPQSGGATARDILIKNSVEPLGDMTLFAQHLKDSYPDRRKGITDEEVVGAYMEFKKSFDNQVA